ncbi:MAG: hypothetical protein ABI760_21865 [Ferruginibacter sp.]
MNSKINGIKYFRAGDVIWADSTGKYHLTIILEDQTDDNHQECIPICNFSGTEPHEHLNYVIPIGTYNLPDTWWTKHDQAKPENWIICQPKDCIKAFDYSPESVVGNLKEDCPVLYVFLCEKTKNCKIAPRLKKFCDCDSNELDEAFDDSDCECQNRPGID